MTLDFCQIYFKEEQLKELYPFALPHRNDSITDYFENSVISELVPISKADLIGVASWRLNKKRGDSFRLTDKSLTKEKILTNDFDIAVLTPRSPSHKMLFMASQWHGKIWDEALRELRGFMKVPVEVTTAIYENHFIAKREIYHQYVNEALIPCMAFMDSHKVFKENAGYARRKTPAEQKEYRDKTGREDWPIAPFVLERLFSIWIEGKGFKTLNL